MPIEPTQKTNQPRRKGIDKKRVAQAGDFICNGPVVGRCVRPRMGDRHGNFSSGVHGGPPRHQDELTRADLRKPWGGFDDRVYSSPLPRWSMVGPSAPPPPKARPLRCRGGAVPENTRGSLPKIAFTLPRQVSADSSGNLSVPAVSRPKWRYIHSQDAFAPRTNNQKPPKIGRALFSRSRKSLLMHSACLSSSKRDQVLLRVKFHPRAPGSAGPQAPAKTSI